MLRPSVPFPVKQGMKRECAPKKILGVLSLQMVHLTFSV